MHKFFLKTSLFIFGLSLLLNGLGTLSNKVAPLEDWRVDHLQNYDALMSRSDQIEAITLGNSHSFLVDYTVLGLEGQSLTLAAADLFEIEKYVFFLDGRLPKLGTVFITISYYSFSRDNAVFESLRPRRIGFYSMIPIWSPIQGDLSNFFLGKLDAYTHVMSVTRSDSWQEVWKRLPNYPSPTELVPYDGIRTLSEWGECLHFSTEQLDAHAQEIAGKNVTSSRQMAAAHPGLENHTFDALSRAIEHLQSRGIRVIMFTPGYYEAYNRYFANQGSGIIEAMHQEVDRIQKAYQVEYYDLSTDSELASHPELFYNSDHVSECGQKAYSQKLFEAMR